MMCVFIIIYTGQNLIPAPENVSACVMYQGNNTLLNVQWDVSMNIMYVIIATMCVVH